MRKGLTALILTLCLIILAVPGSAALTKTEWVDGDYNYVKWNGTGSTTYTIPGGVTNLYVLVVAGGGGGGGATNNYGGAGGGGAGGVNYTEALTVAPDEEISISVGDGGAGGGAGADGTNGTASSFGVVTAVGGGGGAKYTGSGAKTGLGGGSGGGGTTTGGGGPGTEGQGNNGGGSGSGQSGGGGGAGSTGSAGSGGAGGDAVTHLGVTVGGGGGGGTRTIYAGGYGGTGGGRGGGSNGVPTAGTDETGGGGGGGRGYNSNTAGAKGGSGVVIIKYLSIDAPTADFSANITEGEYPLTVAFTDESTNDPTSWEWSWGDGTDNSNSQNPEHTYSSPGSYTVSLTATNEAGSDTETKNDYITVNYVPPIAQFSVNNTNGYAPLTIAFIDESTYLITDYSWNIDNSGGAEYTGNSCTHTYTTPGTYTVKLTVSNPAGEDSEIKMGLITVFSSSPTTRPTTAPTTAPTTTAVPESLDETMAHVQELLPNFINMVSSALSGFLIIGVVMVVIGLFANLKGVLFRLLRRRKW